MSSCRHQASIYLIEKVIYLNKQLRANEIESYNKVINIAPELSSKWGEEKTEEREKKGSFVVDVMKE